MAAVRQTLPLSLLLNGDTAARSDSVTYFELPHYSLSELRGPWGPFTLQPTHGPIVGGSLVTIRGLGFANAATATRCRFGNIDPVSSVLASPFDAEHPRPVEGRARYDAPPSGADGVRQPGEPVDAIVCVSPQHPWHAQQVQQKDAHLPAATPSGGLESTFGLLELGSFEPESFHVDVALNGQQFGSTGLQFLYTAPVRVPDPDYNVTEEAAVAVTSTGLAAEPESSAATSPVPPLRAACTSFAGRSAPLPAVPVRICDEPDAGS